MQYREKLSLLEKYIVSQCPLSVSEVEKATAEILVSFKAGKKVAVVGTRKIGKRGNKTVVQRGIIVPRGALSNEKIYGKIKVLDKNRKLKDLFENPSLIFKPYIKALVEQRLAEYGGDKKKALASLKKSPIYLDKNKTKVLEYATCFREEYVIKTVVDTEFEAKWTDDIVDGHIKEVLKNRLAKFHDNPKKAFADVKIGNDVLKWYQDEGLERPIRSVRSKTGLSAVVPNKNEGNGYVKPDNNHHIAIYRDKDGKLLEHICTFWHAVERKKYGFAPVIDDTNAVWDIVQFKDDYPQSFLNLLPPQDSKLVLSMQQNEMFILDMTTEEIKDAMESNEYNVISDHLYRVQKLTSKDYVFRHHLETTVKDGKELLDSKRYYSIRSFNRLFELNPTKVRVDYLGNILPLTQ